MRMIGRIAKMGSKGWAFTIGLTLSLAVVVGLGLSGQLASRVQAAVCDDNDMIKCGFTDAANFISIVRANNNNGHQDLQSLYAGFGLTAADYDNFAQHAVPGEVHRDGTVWVNGVKVASNVMTYGRNRAYHGSNPDIKTFAGIQYYGNVPSVTFASGVTSLKVYVLFDANGSMRMAFMSSCGNPAVAATVVQTSATCNVLNATPTPGKPGTYTFSASATANGNATLKSFVFDFGDGHTKTVSAADASKPFEYTYATPGNYSAKVTVFASVPGNDNLQLPVVSTCTKAITISSYACASWSEAIDDKNKLFYTFTVTATMSGGATLTSADFDFGDGTTAAAVKPASSTTVTVPHTYAASGQYNITATLHFNTPNGPVTAPTCQAQVTPQNITPECKPNVPIGSPECIPPCQPGSSVPPTAAQCQPPLPNTGAGNTIALFAGVLVAGFLVYRQLLFRKHKAAFVAAQMGTSPLPLGDPLSDQPLAGTPLAPQARSLRRKRFF